MHHFFGILGDLNDFEHLTTFFRRRQEVQSLFHISCLRRSHFLSIKGKAVWPSPYGKVRKAILKKSNNISLATIFMLKTRPQQQFVVMHFSYTYKLRADID